MLRKHSLVERMLSDVVGISWAAVHHEADRWGDDVSDEAEQHLVALLGDPGTCPHGNPIPGSANIPDQSASVPLATVPLGPVRVVRIGEVVEEDDEVMLLLAAAGFTPGAGCEVIAVQPDGSVVVAGSRADTVVPARAAGEVYVELV
jgi:DtxR family Mn-dependent transcriptional regulator